MEFIGTKFSLTLGSWRLNIGFNIEEVREPAVASPVRMHHVAYPRDYSNVR